MAYVVMGDAYSRQTLVQVGSAECNQFWCPAWPHTRDSSET